MSFRLSPDGHPRVLRDPGSLFGGGKAPPPAPTPLPPPTMPDPMSPDVLAARRKALSTAMQGGRQSTQLTTPLAAGMGGGAAPAANKLGG